jgi:hypothetical protein
MHPRTLVKQTQKSNANTLKKTNHVKGKKKTTKKKKKKNKTKQKTKKNQKKQTNKHCPDDDQT